MNLTNPIFVFDIESTGIDVVNDRIVELCYIKVYPNGNKESKTMRLNPEMHIPEQASAIHGIYDADVADCPTFKEIARDLQATLTDCDFAGFNSNRFDVPILVEEFLRAGIDVNIRNRRFIDVQNIFHKMEKRTLIAAYKFYCNKDLENAHSALADTSATLEVLEAQLDHYPDDLKNDIDFLAEFSKMNNNVDFAGRMIYDENGDTVFNFGKYKGHRVADVLRTDSGYYNWILQGDFARDTKQELAKLRLKLMNR